MQVFGLPGHVIRNAKAASRLTTQPQASEAAIRRAAVCRCRGDTLSLAKTAPAAIAPAAPRRAEELAARADPGDRATARASSNSTPSSSTSPRKNRSIKHFTAYDPVAKWTVAKAFNRATAKTAAIFLDKLTDQMPFTAEAIQVDGGAEFKAEFEQACQNKGIRLYELPPKTPQLNGAVERCNGAWRHEFY